MGIRETIPDGGPRQPALSSGMPVARWPLREALARLERHYGTPAPLPLRDPFKLVLWECCAYLVDDARRARVYARLVKATGADPRLIAAMKPGALAELIAADGGMQPARRAEKLQRAANLVLEWGQEELRALCRSDPARARKLLQQFPGIGEPGADRILMISGSLRTLAPDSNGARVLVRLGFGKLHPRYDRMYRSAVEATEPELAASPAGWVRAHQLLRQHGKTLCKTSAPRCGECPLEERCPGAQA
jgi:endonuclease III related protein